jgi:hypothetical protein
VNFALRASSLTLARYCISSRFILQKYLFFAIALFSSVFFGARKFQESHTCQIDHSWHTEDFNPSRKMLVWPCRAQARALVLNYTAPLFVFV